MNIFQELYSEDAENIVSPISLSGKLQFQKYALKGIVPDVVKKLELRPTDTLLDIGCNCGEITIPLSFLCDSITGIDCSGVIRRLNERTKGITNINSIVGDFLEVDITEKYDCILIYSVLIYMDSYDEKARFIKKAASLLKPNGRMLIGDVVNTSTIERYKNSEVGRLNDEKYRKQIAEFQADEDRNKKQSSAPEIKNRLNDRTLMQLLFDIRSWGYESFLLPQDPNLAFGYTRQDILVKAWG